MDLGSIKYCVLYTKLCLETLLLELGIGLFCKCGVGENSTSNYQCPSNLGFPGSTVVKNTSTMQGTQEMQVQSLGWEGPLEYEMETCSLFLPGKSHGQKSLAGCSSWGCRVGHNLVTQHA